MTSFDPVSAPLSVAGLSVSSDRTAAYRRMHEHGSVARLEGGGFVIIDRRNVEYALRHPELFSSRMAFAGVGSPLPMVPIEFDPPEHTDYRRVLQPFFSRQAILPLREQVTSLAAALIDRFIDSGRCDFGADVAVPLPAEVFLSFFGLPIADRDRILAWKGAISGPTVVNGQRVPPEAAAQAGAELHAYLAAHLQACRSDPGSEGLLARLLADPDAGKLSDAELLGMSVQFVLAGLDTVTSALGNAFAILAQRSDLQRRIVEDPDGIADAVDELLRYDGPVFVVPRVSTRDVELDGVTVPAGSRVNIAVSAANRDPSFYDNPDDIDLKRRKPHTAFGVGAHRCIGSALAKLEMRSVIDEWHRRIPSYRLAAGAEPRAPWPNGLIGIRSLPLEFPPGGGPLLHDND